MNIAASFPEEAILELSSMQRLTLRAAYHAAKREQATKWYEARKLRDYIDKYANYLFPVGDLEDDVRGLIEAAWQARAKARGIQAKMGAVRG